jgi:serine/threonine protein kinase
MGDRIGQQLGNYRLTQILGRGGFAEVYLGEHIYLKTLTAIKVLQTRLSDTEDIGSFLKEAQMIARLSHPGIVRVMDFGIDNETPFLVMDYAPNGTLRQRHPKGSRLPLSTIVPYVKQLADALHYAHSEKLIHRDIKPENLLVGKRKEILLSDFGIALIAQSSRYQSTQDVVGTVAYMSPEQIQGKPRPASDQYSLAVVIYEWLCGDRPFHGSFTELCTQHIFASPPPLREKVPAISSDVERVIMTALAKEPKERFGNIQAFANALEQASQQPSSQQEIMTNEPSRPQTSHPKPLFDDIQSPPPLRSTQMPSIPPTQFARNSPSPNVFLSQESSIRQPSAQSLAVSNPAQEKIRIWSIGKQQVIIMLLGIALATSVSALGGWSLGIHYNPNYRVANIIIGLILLGVVEVIPLFSGAVFGPWVGFFIGGIGFFTSLYPAEYFSSGDNFTINEYLNEYRYNFNWLFLLSFALLGFIAGLTLLKTQGRFNKFRTIAFVWGTMALAAIIVLSIITLIQEHGIIINYIFLIILRYLTFMLPGLLLLPIAIFIYSKTIGKKIYVV